MGNDGFFSRWSKLKSENNAKIVSPADPSVMPGAPADQLDNDQVTAKAKTQTGLPTLADVARLTADSDYSAFVAPGVDRNVQRMALKKLFLDPRINAMDRLDIYIDDYTKPDPISAAMLASLRHVHSVLGRPDEPDAEDVDADEVSQDQLQANVSAPNRTASEPFFPSNSADHPPSTITTHSEEAVPFPDQPSSKRTV